MTNPENAAAGVRPHRRLADIMADLRADPALVGRILDCPDREGRHRLLVQAGLVDTPYRPKPEGPKTYAASLVPPGYLATCDGLLIQMGPVMTAAVAGLG